jgi:hypothetical protein
MYRLELSYLEKLPGAMREVKRPNRTTREECIYTRHSIRASTATVLIAAGVEIRKV